jgi:D-arabinose 1-dehydrogenase-like Zn-dependent alcohol dehydrogenase
MTTIRAAAMTASRAPIEIGECPVPDLPLGTALSRTRSSEVCGTDVHLWHGRHGLEALNEVLADAERMRVPEALVSPNGVSA